MKINHICRENVQTVHGTEYILIDDFFDTEVFNVSHNIEYMPNYMILNDELPSVVSLSGHPLMDLLKQREEEILSAINKVWNETCVENKSCVNLMLAASNLPIHNDSHWPSIPVRGVLYLDQVCGTTFHSDYFGNDPVEVGGKPNQLLLFKVSEHSHHSVGLNKTEKTDRFSIVMMFDRNKE